MKILIVSASSEGGAGIAAHRLFEALQRTGSDVRFLSLAGSPVGSSEGLWIDQFHGFRRKLVKVWGAVSGSARRAWEEKRWLGRDPRLEVFSRNVPLYGLLQHPWYREADVVHFHWAHFFFPWVEVLRGNHPKVFLTLHDVNWLTGGCHYTGGCDQFHSRCQVCPQLVGTGFVDLARKQYLQKVQFLKRNPLYVQGIIGPSKWIEGQAHLSGLWRHLPMTTIPNAHDVEKYRPLNREVARELFGLTASSPVILIVGHALENQRKGFDLLVPLMKEELGQWVAVGRPSALLPDSVRQLGFIRDEMLMVMVLNAADVLVVPSREENYSNLILEARLCGTPVVAFDVGGNREAVEPGVGGLLASGVDSDSMRSVLADALGRKWDRAAVSKLAGERVNFKVVADRHREFYVGQ